MFRTVLVISALFVLSLGTSPSDTRAADECLFASPGEAQAMAERAAKYVDTAGPKEAFIAFMTPGSEFFDRDLYVFVLDFEGVLYASGASPQLIGTVAIDAQDREGRPFVLNMITMAQNEGKGWVEYELVHPCTGEVTPKISYVIRTGDFLVGVGAFGTIAT